MRCGGRLVEVMEFGAHLIGVGVVEFVEDVLRVSPGVTGCAGVAGGVVGVAEVGEDFGFVAALAETPDQVEGVLEAGDGLWVVAEVVVGVAETVPGCGLTGWVAEALVQGEGLLAGREGL